MSAIAIDVRTLVFLTMYVAFIEALALFFLWRTRRTYPGFGHWLAGYVAFIVAFAMIGLRGILPDVVSIWLANVVLTFAAVLQYEGTLRFRGQSGHASLGIGLTLVAAVVTFYFRYADDQIAVRMVAISLLLAIAFGLVTRALVRRVPPGQRTPHYLTGGIFALMAAFMFFRAAWIAFGPHVQTELFSATSRLQMATFLLPLLLSIPWTFGFIILNSQRLEMALYAEMVEREMAEREVQGSEEKYRLLVERMPLAIYVHTRGRIVYANPAFLALFKAAAPDEVIGRPLGDFFHPDTLQEIEARRRVMAETQETLPPLELNLRRLDGSSVTVVTTPMPIVFLGEPAILTALYDITERKQSEIELQKTRRLLELQAREIEALREGRKGDSHV